LSYENQCQLRLGKTEERRTGSIREAITGVLKIQVRPLRHKVSWIRGPQ
jgi:hypothetical protein